MVKRVLLQFNVGLKYFIPYPSSLSIPVILLVKSIFLLSTVLSFHPGWHTPFSARLPSTVSAQSSAALPTACTYPILALCINSRMFDGLILMSIKQAKQSRDIFLPFLFLL